MHANSLMLFEKYALNYFAQSSRVLEIGPDRYPSSYRKKCGEVLAWDTLEMKGVNTERSPTIEAADPYHYQIPDASYDIVLSGNVMEHVPDIWRWTTELKRVVRPGGILLLVTPVSWPFHEEPVDAWRIYPEGMKSFASHMGLEVVEIHRECLETGVLKDLRNLQFIEGRSCFHDTGMRGLRKINWYNGFLKNLPVLRHLRISTEVAWDLITVLRKSS